MCFLYITYACFTVSMQFYIFKLVFFLLLSPCYLHAFLSCPDGQFSYDDILCRDCPSDGYCQAGVLSLCPAHSTSQAGSSLPTQCNCENGYFRTNTYQCLPCPSGYICSNNQKSICASGSYSLSQSTECTTCPVGTFQSVGGSSSCPTCPGGLSVLQATSYTELF